MDKNNNKSALVQTGNKLYTEPKLTYGVTGSQWINNYTNNIRLVVYVEI